MAAQDTNGRSYARLDQVQPGEWLETDAGFECIEEGTPLQVCKNERGLFVKCIEGAHYLDGQDEGDGYITGFYYLGMT